MAIKVNMPQIPILAEVGLSDKALVSYGTAGAARLVSLSVIGALIGAQGPGAMINADDGSVYQLVGVTAAGGEMMISAVRMWSGLLAAEATAQINADDGHIYRLVGNVVAGVDGNEISIGMELVS